MLAICIQTKTVGADTEYRYVKYLRSKSNPRKGYTYEVDNRKISSS